jgi:hypothetical protein
LVILKDINPRAEAIRAISRAMFGNFLAIFWQFLAIFWQFFGNFWQLELEQKDREQNRRHCFRFSTK